MNQSRPEGVLAALKVILANLPEGLLCHESKSNQKATESTTHELPRNKEWATSRGIARIVKK